MRFLLVKYSDSSYAVLDRTASNPQQAIIGYSYGHFESVAGLQWVAPSSKKGGKFAGSNWNSSSRMAQSESFVTCGSDMSVFIWKHFGDRWSFSYIDVVKCFDSTLSYQRKQCERST